MEWHSACQGNASPYKFLSFPWPLLLSTQYTWSIQGRYWERKKLMNKQNTHTQLSPFFFCLLHQWSFAALFTTFADNFVAQNRCCRAPLLCFWLACRRRQQHSQGEESWAAAPSQSQACPCGTVPAIAAWGGSRDRLQSATHSALQISRGWDEVQSSSSAHRGALSSRISAGSGLDSHQLYKTLSMRAPGQCCRTRAGFRELATALCPPHHGEKRCRAPFWWLPSFPQAIARAKPSSLLHAAWI